MSGAASADLPPKPTVIGLYGVPGCGKTYLLHQLKEELDGDSFAFYEGSEVINKIAPGGLEAFKLLDEHQKNLWRHRAIQKIQNECLQTGKTAVVTGHFMFWQPLESVTPVMTSSDEKIYTHIVYLDIPAHVIQQRRREDQTRDRPSMSERYIEVWKEVEKSSLEILCAENEILFFVWTQRSSMASLIRDLNENNEARNLRNANECLDKALEDAHSSGCLEKVLVLDADRTMTAEDTGNMWWEEHWKAREFEHRANPLETLFGSKLGYSYKAFRQATFLYEVASDDEFDAACQATADAVRMYPQIKAFLHLVSQKKHLLAVVITSGLRLVWEKILVKEGLSDSVRVIGGGRLTDNLIITPDVKASLVTRLQDVHKLETLAFGDSSLDIPMLKKANRAIVVVGKEETRSKTMDRELKQAIDMDSLSANQVLFPSSVSPRLDTTRLPVLDLMDPEFVRSLLEHRHNLRIRHATETSVAKMLQTPTRDSSYAGPSLHKAHTHCGRYLALHYVTDIIGVEAYDTPHVQGHNTTGFRLAQESKTLIVALMRGGSPMALGVFKVFPTAAFLHASGPEEVKANMLQGRSTVILVDSVVNSGNSVVKFVEHIRGITPHIRIVVVTGVVQTEAVARHGAIWNLSMTGDFTLVALRISENKFTGKRGTDTGNRLFNTTHLD